MDYLWNQLYRRLEHSSSVEYFFLVFETIDNTKWYLRFGTFGIWSLFLMSYLWNPIYRSLELSTLEHTTSVNLTFYSFLYNRQHKEIPNIWYFCIWFIFIVVYLWNHICSRLEHTCSADLNVSSFRYNKQHKVLPNIWYFGLFS